MQTRRIKIVTLVSTLLLGISILLFIFSYFYPAREYHLTVSESCHVGLFSQNLDARIAFFSDAESGPYRGSIIGLCDSQGNVHPPRKRERAFGDTWGIYYRYFEWDDYGGMGHYTLWSLMISLWYPIVLFALLPLRWIWHQFRRRQTKTITS